VAEIPGEVMREFREPTCANFLKEPFVLGVKLMPLLLLTLLVGVVQAAGFPFPAIGLAVLGYGILRLHAHFGKNGSEEALLFFLEKRLSKPKPPITEKITFEFKHPDTLDEEEAVFHKSSLEEEFRLPPGKSKIIRIRITEPGAFLE
jgi:hypothetical protein